MKARVIILLLLIAMGGSANAQSEGKDLSEAHARDSIATCLRLVDEGHGGHGSMRSVDLALTAWALAREYAPDLAEVGRVKLAQAYLAYDLPAKALKHADGVLFLNPASSEAMLVKANALAVVEEHNEAMVVWKELLRIRPDDPVVGMRALHGLMHACSAQEQWQDAMMYGEALLALCRSHATLLDAGAQGNEMGRLASAAGMPEAALHFYSGAMRDLEAHPRQQVEVAVNRAAELIRLDRIPEALALLEQARVKAVAIGDASTADRSLLMRSAAYLLEGRTLDALELANTARISAEGRRDTLVLIEAYDLLAHVRTKYGQHQQARGSANDAAALRDILRDKDDQRRNARNARLTEAQRHETQFMQRFEEQQRERQRLRLLRHETDERTQQLELARVESNMRNAVLERAVEHAAAERSLALARTALLDEQQVRTIQALEIARGKQALELARKEQQHQAQQKEVELLVRDKALRTAQAERESAKQRSVFWLMLFLAAVGLGAVVGLVLMRRKNHVIRTQMQQIGTINAQLTAKNTDILSSITYAQNIQRTIIPTEGQLRELLPDSFLYYKPRDIVSGDLPFIRREGDRVFIATIDCTGHGVPAAMLSFMAYYNLNNIISTYKDFAVGDILLLLHQRIQDTVRSKVGDHTFSDGMDISLVELDLASNRMWYSGAQNSLLVVRGGECQRIKGDRCSIGDPAGECAIGFRTHQMDLLPSDRIYMYSDGFIHQFGGEGGRKKYSNAQLMRTVTELATRSTEEAAQGIAKAHRDWQQNEPQTDDILLIGFSMAKRAATKAA